MSRKTDEELLEEMKARKKVRDAEDEIEDLRREEEDEEDDSDDKSSKKAPTQIIEREINLSLINEKINFIISKLQEK